MQHLDDEEMVQGHFETSYAKDVRKNSPADYKFARHAKVINEDEDRDDAHGD